MKKIVLISTMSLLFHAYASHDCFEKDRPNGHSKSQLKKNMSFDIFGIFTRIAKIQLKHEKEDVEKKYGGQLKKIYKSEENCKKAINSLLKVDPSERNSFVKRLKSINSLLEDNKYKEPTLHILSRMKELRA